MAHRAATDEICVRRGMGKSPSSRRRGLVRVPVCCLLAPKDLACYNMLDPKSSMLKNVLFSGSYQSYNERVIGLSKHCLS